MRKIVYAYLHTHWDREWYRDKEDFNLRLIEVLDIVLDELKQNKAPFFYLDGQVIALEDYLKYRPNKKEEIIELIKKKKLAIGPYFVSADSYLADFNSMLKNLDIGLKISKDFSQKEFVGYMADIFGISKSIFEALKIKNIDKALIWRGVNPLKINENCNFLKNGIKTTWLAQGYFNDFLHQEAQIEKVCSNLKKYLDKISKYSLNNCLLPIGADHLGMLKNANKKIEKINSILTDYEIILTSPFEYFKNNEFKNEVLEQEFLDNSDTYILQGVYSARIPQKIQNAKLQNKLSRIIEPLNYYLKEKYAPNIDFAYKTLIKNHAHDGIYGCSVDEVHRTTKARFEKVDNIQKAVLKSIIGNFKAKNKIQGNTTNKIGLFNLSNQDNLKIVEIKTPYKIKNAQVIKKERGFVDELLYNPYKIPVTEDITNLYTQLVEINDNKKFNFNTLEIKKPFKKTIITNKTLENDFIKISVKNHKLEILDKINNKKIKSYLKDTIDDGDSYNFSPNKSKTLKILSSKTDYDGLIQSCLKINFEQNITLKVKLDNQSKNIKFEALINNKKKNHKLQFCSILNNEITKAVSSEAIGLIQREIDPHYDIKKFMPAKRPQELKTNSFPMQGFVNVDNFSISTIGLYEYEIFKNELNICLLRCFSTISNPKNPTRAIPAGPDLKTPEAQLLEKINCEFSIGFNNIEESFLMVDELNKNYIAVDGEFKSDLNFKLFEIQDGDYFYCVNNKKNIVYNVKKDLIKLI